MKGEYFIMCTAISVRCIDHYFGRNLDYEHGFGETITITPRNFKLSFRHYGDLKTHYAIIGMALVDDNYPLYFDATNEKGLSMAGLNFPVYAHYNPYINGKENFAPFELIPWILSQCSNIAECRKALENINIEDINFSEKLTNTPLHWIISDKNESLTVEPTKEGLKLYQNPVGVLTNSPTFEFHMFNLNNYMSLSERDPQNTFLKDNNLNIYSRGMGALGLPGDLSSTSRFVRACYVKEKSIFGKNETNTVTQFFHILYSVYQQNGCVEVSDKMFEKTIYSSCCNTDKGIYYYTTYGNSSICAVDMHNENLDSDELITFPLINEQKIFFQNKKNKCL